MLHATSEVGGAGGWTSTGKKRRTKRIYWIKASFGIWGCETHHEKIRFVQSRAKESRRNAP